MGYEEGRNSKLRIQNSKARRVGVLIYMKGWASPTVDQ
jgi:hypothetical protein